VFVVAVGASLEPSHEAALQDWARARGIVIEAPRVEQTAAAYDPALVLQIEALLDDARVLVGALDEAAALERVAEAERLLRAHPELPQAAFLLAERYDVEAMLEDSHRDGAAAAARLRERARALEGPRAPVLTASGDAPPNVARRGPSTQRVAIARTSPDDTVEVDGAAVASSAELAAGEHHVRVLRRGGLVWAGFVEISDAATSLALPTPPAPACSTADLSGIRVQGGVVVVPAKVRCPSWAAVRPMSHGHIEVATCEGARCGALLAWSAGKSELYEGPPQPPPAKGGFPAWAGWAIAGGISLVAAGVVLWQSGVFDEPERGRRTWVYGGVGEAALRF
jgi:hypothetical protein